MMKQIILAGFGGQGIIAAGKLLAVAAMKEGKQVTHFPSYGAEMRGGTCNCSVVVNDDLIASPIISKPDIVVVLNNPSLLKYKDLCVSSGMIIVNSSLSDGVVERSDVVTKKVAASEIAEKTGNPRGANMVALGALAKLTGVVTIDSLIESIPVVFPNFKPNVIAMNENAIREGFSAAN